MGVSVRVAGKRGRVTVQPNKGATVAEVVAEAAEVLNIPGFQPSAMTHAVDGTPVAGDTVLPDDAAQVDAAPHARQG